MTMRTVFLTMLMLMATVCVSGQNVDFNGQHYRLWKVAPSDSVELQGQFDDEWWQATVGAIEYLANPAVKAYQGTPSTTSEHRHLTAYMLTPARPQPRRKVRIWNQFTPDAGEDWEIEQPIWLLVPAAKSHNTIPQMPAPGNHYACYAVIEQNWSPVGNVRLSDQFNDPVDRIRRIKPVALCVPVMKRHRTPEVPLTDRHTHFAIYTLEPPRKISTQVYTADQFSTQALEATDREMLAVPTRKQWPVP